MSPRAAGILVVIGATAVGGLAGVVALAAFDASKAGFTVTVGLTCLVCYVVGGFLLVKGERTGVIGVSPEGREAALRDLRQNGLLNSLVPGLLVFLSAVLGLVVSFSVGRTLDITLSAIAIAFLVLSLLLSRAGSSSRRPQ